MNARSDSFVTIIPPDTLVYQSLNILCIAIGNAVDEGYGWWISTQHTHTGTQGTRLSSGEGGISDFMNQLNSMYESACDKLPTAKLHETSHRRLHCMPQATDG